MIISTISPGLVKESSRIGALLDFIKLSGVMVVTPIAFAMFFPALTKKLLNSLGI